MTHQDNYISLQTQSQNQIRNFQAHINNFYATILQISVFTVSARSIHFLCTPLFYGEPLYRTDCILLLLVFLKRVLAIQHLPVVTFYSSDFQTRCEQRIFKLIVYNPFESFMFLCLSFPFHSNETLSNETKRGGNISHHFVYRIYSFYQREMN